MQSRVPLGPGKFHVVVLVLSKIHPLQPVYHMLRNRLFPSRRFTYAMFIRKWKVCDGVKHPPYCLFTGETRVLTDLASYVTQLALYEPKSEENTIFRACLPRLAHKAPVMQAKPILVVGGLCGHWLFLKVRILYKLSQSVLSMSQLS